MSETTDNRFNLDPGIYRTMEERQAMVEDPECPEEVLWIVAEHDEDQNVLESIYFRDDNSDRTKEILAERITGNPEDLNRRRNIRQYEIQDNRHKVFCGIPWNHISTNADGSIRMCCQMTQEDVEPMYGTLMKPTGKAFTGKDPVEDYRNHPDLRKVRADMLKGIDPAICRLCTHEEKNGIGSRRSGTKKNYPDMFERAIQLTDADGTINTDDFPLEYIDLRFGNKCNLKCRSCGPTDSNLWYEDFYKITEVNKMPPGEFQYRKHEVMTVEKHKDGTYDVAGMLDWWEDSGLWNYIITNVENIDRYYFTGGEPTINLKHRELLDLIIERGVADRVCLEYNTNMAGIPSKVFTQWKHFKEVRIGMSVDGIHDHFEYIRNPAKWTVAEKNMRRIDTEEGFDHVNACISLTLSAYNVLHLLDMVWWWREQRWNRLQDWIVIHNLYGPKHMNIQNFPDSVKQYIDRRYNQFIDDIQMRWRGDEDRFWKRKTITTLRAVLDHMWQKEQDPTEWMRFHTWTKQMDDIRSESFDDAIPELAKVIADARATETRTRTAKLKTAGKKR